MPHDPRFFCSDLSREHREKAYGTGGRGDVWLLLEYGGEWKRNAFADSQLSDRVKSHIRSFLKEVPNGKVLFIKQERSPKTHITTFVVVAREHQPQIYRTDLTSYEELLDIDIPALIVGQPSNNTTLIDHPLFLVCTHGKHDKCCAKYGLPIYKEVRHHAGHTTWQTSHVGGDRFAANLVCFPHGIFYGHVSLDDIKRIVDDYQQARVYVHEYKYRGRACYVRAAQVAEFFVRCESGIRELDRLSLVAVSVEADNLTWHGSFISTDNNVHHVTFLADTSIFQNFLTCGAVEKKSVVQYRLTEYVVTVSSVGCGVHSHSHYK